MNEISPSDEIDLLQLIETIWDGKWKIIAITVACVSGVLGFQVFGPSPSFVATTEIKPILEGDAENFRLLNELDFYKVYRDLNSRQIDRERDKDKDKDKDKVKDKDKDKAPFAILDQLFIEQLGNRALLAKVLKNQGLISKKDFESERDYERALRELVAEISVLPPTNEDGAKRGESRRHWTLTFEYNDEDKWLSALHQLDKIATKEVLETIKKGFSAMVRAGYLDREHMLEDISTQIDNALADYDTKTTNRLAFLKEQALVARKLGVAKSTIEAQTFSAQNGMVASVTTDKPFYLRGYEAIEKEIELISSRKDKRAFVIELLELEQEKRALEQYKTLERAEALFAETPIMTQIDFKAARFAIEGTRFAYKGKRALMLALAAVVGGMIGVVYVLIASAMRGKREAEVG